MLTLEFKKDNNTRHLNIMSSEQPSKHGYKVCFWDYNKGTEKFKWIDVLTFWNTFNVSFKGHKIEPYNNDYMMYSKDENKCRTIRLDLIEDWWLDALIKFKLS